MRSPMNRLVEKFEEDLEISRKSAKKKVAKFLLYLVVAVVIVMVVFLIFPWKDTYVYHTYLPPGNYTQAEEIVTQEKVRFYQAMVDGEKIFLALSNSDVSYALEEEEGVFRQHSKKIRLWEDLRYEKVDQTIRNDEVITRYHRALWFIVLEILIAVIVLIFLFDGVYRAQRDYFYKVWI